MKSVELAKRQRFQVSRKFVAAKTKKYPTRYINAAGSIQNIKMDTQAT